MILTSPPLAAFWHRLLLISLGNTAPIPPRSSEKLSDFLARRKEMRGATTRTRKSPLPHISRTRDVYWKQSKKWQTWFSTMGMEYPPTSTGGTAIICPRRINGKDHNTWRMLQFTTGQGGGGHQEGVSVPFFGGITCTKRTRRCTGCTVSRFTLPSIANSSHTSVKLI